MWRPDNYRVWRRSSTRIAGPGVLSVWELIGNVDVFALFKASADFDAVYISGRVCMTLNRAPKLLIARLQLAPSNLTPRAHADTGRSLSKNSRPSHVYLSTLLVSKTFTASMVPGNKIRPGHSYHISLRVLID